jgi:hypothetical protein
LTKLPPCRRCPGRHRPQVRSRNAGAQGANQILPANLLSP